MAPFNNRLDHFILHNLSNTERFVSPRSVRDRARYPVVLDPASHAAFLLDKLNSINAQILEEPEGHLQDSQLILEFEGDTGCSLVIKSLDLKKSGIEILTVTERDNRIVATVLVPKGKLGVFIKKVEQYRDEETRFGKRKNKKLIESISNIKLAILHSLWTDPSSFPHQGIKVWWEVWIRETETSLQVFQEYCRTKEILVDGKVLSFVDRKVLLVYATVEELIDVMTNTSLIAELRSPKITPPDFLGMNTFEQREWAQELVGLITPPNLNSPSICILDTGIAIGHPLIQVATTAAELQTCFSVDGPDDRRGHGTWMAGLALYGDLKDALLTRLPIRLTHRLESVKILPNSGANRPELYGRIIQDALSLAEGRDSQRKRIICMAVTATDSRDRGEPTSWSAAIDKTCHGINGQQKRLFLISAGNADTANLLQYPDSNHTDGVHDPGQSWNALTIGAFTNKTEITETDFEGWEALAPAGGLCPTSTTSYLWANKKWPIKPDVVFEGGNAAIDPPRTSADLPDSLSLLTTYHDFNQRLFTTIGDTSAATAQAARMAAIIQEKYPQMWPETVRALIVHSADWTPQMRRQFAEPHNRTQKEDILRFFGYGVPNLEKALWSASNSLTLVCEDELQPFERKKMKEMNLHQLPWPRQELLDLGAAQVEMRVTLSYFIEPNPARRGWEIKHRYQSHGLRFDVKTQTENLNEFRTRLNKAAQDEEGISESVTSGDSDRWEFGSRIRTKGSVHSDYWVGSAVELAERGVIGVFPVVGWWREKISSPMAARYSLIVTIKTPSVDVDIYTPVSTQITVTT